jgi:hypothetical protein
VLADTHGKVNDFTIYNDSKHKNIFHLGDIGLGFREDLNEDMPFGNVKFIRGNHDNPFVALRHPNYLGDYGYIEKLDLFYVSGAASVSWDRAHRTEGLDWWPEEELSYSQAEKAFELYKEKKPSLVISHDAPVEVPLKMRFLTPDRTEPSITNQLLQFMFETHQPKKWAFGHWHISRRVVIKGTIFHCVGENGRLSL